MDKHKTAGMGRTLKQIYRGQKSIQDGVIEAETIISDVFNPALTGITVTLDDTVLTEGVGYTYNAATGAFTTLDGVVTVPAATYTADPVTGAISTTPGVAILTVTGTV